MSESWRLELLKQTELLVSIMSRVRNIHKNDLMLSI